MKKGVLAVKAGYKRGTYYLHIKDPDLSDAILNKYAKALDYDFSQDIPGIEKQLIDEPSTEYGNEPKTLQEAKVQTDFWRQKYYELLDKYVKVIEEGKEK